MKGMELPVSMIVVIAVAVLVLVAVIAFFVSGFSNSSNSISQEQAFVTGCNNLRSIYSCNPDSVNSVSIPGYKPSGSSSNGCLAQLCSIKGARDTIKCAQLCGCPIYNSQSAALDASCGSAGGASLPSASGLPGTPGTPA